MENLTREQKIERFLVVMTDQIKRMVKEGASSETITEYNKAMIEQIKYIK